MKVVGVVLAAGQSRRLGRPKQLVSVDGEPLVRRIARVVRASRCVDVAIVVGAHAEAVRAVVADFPVVTNEAWSEGVASSVRCAVEWAESAAADALALFVGDQPRLTTAHVDALVDRAGPHPVGSAYDGIVGVPAVFPRSTFAGLKALRGAQGARALLRGPDVVAIPWPDGAFDVDVPEDVAGWDPGTRTGW